jgi:hypothetical protein
MSKLARFAIGGLGGLLPIVASLVAVDLAAISALVDDHQLTEGLCLGYTIRVLGLFGLGGIMAALNSEIQSPMALVQIGIAAPALVTSYMSGATLNKVTSANHAFLLPFVSTAFAANSGEMDDKRIILAGGFFADVMKGAYPGLGVEPKNELRPLNFYKVINTTTNLCTTVPTSDLKQLRQNFPAPNYTISSGVCEPQAGR